ncbi:hypothetical protein P43SY_006556 [Pythium insidiosum]|uniref:Uncharacterized protein n=1 Tax=Pythium insidiosum TaxID=114742 RepID=A0AAD5LZ83_PYTIN|nr:hypothetical protein P43SY_006556 [Pythium insidiosum]
MRELPASIRNVSTRELVLRKNQLVRVGTDVLANARLQSLSLSGNPLQELPSTVGDVSKLAALALENTALTKSPPWLTTWLVGRQGSQSVSLYGSPLCRDGDAVVASFCATYRGTDVPESVRTFIKGGRWEQKRFQGHEPTSRVNGWVKKRLIRENEELYELNAKHMTLEGRLQQIMDQDAPEPLDQLAFYFHQLTDLDIAPIIAVTRDDILRFTNSSDRLSFQASVFGWVDYRQVQGNKLKFALEKRFTGTPTVLLLERTWKILSSPERCAKLFNPAVRADMHLLQRINNDTVLIYRSVETESVDLALKTIYLLTRIQVPEGYMIFFRSIDPELIHFDENGVNSVLEETQQHLQNLHLDGSPVRPTPKPSTWVDMYTWIVFIEEGPLSCRFQFGGSTMSNVWLKEVLFIALRWETLTTRIKCMRSQLEELQAQFDELFVGRIAQQRSDSPNSSMLKRYKDLTELREKLAAENWELQRINQSYITIEGRFRSVWAIEAEPFLADLTFHFQPLPPLEYAKIIANARDGVLRFLRSESKFSPGVTVFGWRDRKSVGDGVLAFALEKSFPLSSYELMQRTWAILSTPTEFVKLYSPSFDVKIHMLQRVNDDTVVLYQSATIAPETYKSIFVLARVKVEDGYLLVVRSIDQDRVSFEVNSVNAMLEDLQAQQDTTRGRSVWIDNSVWVLIRDKPEAPGSCSYHFGGFAVNSAWLNEVLFITLRWEALAVEPIRLLGPQAFDDEGDGEPRET